MSKKTSPASMINNLNERQRAVYYYLVASPFGSMTQSSAGNYLKIPKSTMHDDIQKLIECKVIHKYRGDKYNILYRKGCNYRLIEPYVEADKQSGKYFLRGYDLGVVKRPTPTHSVSWRIHLNSGWIDVPVEKEGALSHFLRGDTGKTVVLFGKRSPTTPNGMLQWNAQIDTDKGKVSVRYQRKAKDSQPILFGIVPPSIWGTGAEVNVLRETFTEAFFSTIAPIYDLLEKWGGWTFKRNDEGHYAFKCKATPEYAADAITTEIMQELRGKRFGIPGRTIEWVDGSSSADGEEEYETNDPDLAYAISEAPNTLKDVQTMKSIVKQDDERLTSLENRVLILERREGA